MAAHTHVELEYGFLLHRRPYRETSVLAEIFTLNHGRIGVVARGARRSRSAFRQSLQAFRPLLFSWQGRGELMTLTAAETAHPIMGLSGDYAISGFYANEILLRLLPRNDPHPSLFTTYETLLTALRNQWDMELSLRRFEKQLLDALGYGLVLNHDFEERPIVSEWRYLYAIETGPVVLKEGDRATDTTVTGATLLGLSSGHLKGEALQESKRLMRRVLAYYIGDKPLVSRELFHRTLGQKNGD